MAFIRIKRIYGNSYGYLVENSWIGGGTRQKVGKYLGKVLSPPKTKADSLQDFLKVQEIKEYVKTRDFRTIAEDMVKLELHNHSVKSEDCTINFHELTVKNRKGKDVLLGLNNGFLCSHTLQKLMNYEPEKDYSGYLLADLMTAAGILPQQDLFIEIYGKFKEKQEAAAAKKFEFYY